MTVMESRLQASEKAPSSTTARRSNQGASSKSQKPSDRPSFTFIDHDDDLASKRIKDANARKAIRSHVMRDVRRRERLAGLKRVSKREDRNRAGAGDKPASKSSNNRKLPLRSSTADSSSSEPNLDLVRSKPRHSTSQVTSPTSRVPNAWFLDPFCTLPGATELPTMTQKLVQYCVSVFIPMTFPVQTKSSRSDEEKLNVMVKTSLTDPGSFFGLMTISAAHRAALTGRHSDLLNSSDKDNRVLYDPDYYLMKARCIREMNEKLRDPARALSHEAFDTIINLLTSALIVGLFDEARIHLRGLKKMVELRGGITSDSIRNSIFVTAILATDLKAATGLMTKPVFPLPWEPKPLDPEVRQRICPPPLSKLNNLGIALFRNPDLSLQLVNALYGLRDVILLQHLGNQNPKGLDPLDYQLLLKKTSEVEHELLSYPYRSFSGNNAGSGGLNIHPTERLAQVAAICSLNSIIIVSPSSTGLGRSLTKHMKQAISNFLTIGELTQMRPPYLDLLAWALFIAAHGSVGQVEWPWFVNRLADVIAARRWKGWEEVAEIMTGYFYLSYLHDPVWRPIWNEAMAHLELANVDA
ncbi:hypothetical protein VTN77DRAFT_8509 [Rasamsonia byssochlamydoides]|uniref:uncharacterized protein n=1 Tax=Rasamsonia byssochlamydoides TaxID=89139 RepID=UPI00374413F1